MTRNEFVISRSSVQSGSPAPTLSTRKTRARRVALWGLQSAALWGLLCAPAPAFAQGDRPVDAHFVVAAVTFGGLQAGDLYSTRLALASGRGVEGNPIMAPLLERRGAAIAVKAAVSVGVVMITAKVHRRHPRIAKASLWMLNGAMAAVVANNVAIARRR